MAEEIKKYKGRYTGPQIDDLLGRVPKVEARVSELERGSDKTQVFTFSQAATVHTVTHQLDKFPSVTIVDYDKKEEVLADVKYLSSSQIELRFHVNIRCIVYLN